VDLKVDPTAGRYDVRTRRVGAMRSKCERILETSWDFSMLTMILR
jgi:hypothetical protein